MTPRATSRSRRALRGAVVVAHMLAVWLLAIVLLPRLGALRHSRLMARVAAHTLAILHVRPRTVGARPVREGPVLLVANHVSWLDVYALGTVMGGSRYVAKREVARWPVAGGIARGCRTFFHARGNARDAARVKDAVASALRAGERVVVFPEGTTTDGHGVGPFHAAFFQAAVDAGVPVQPVAIRYPDLAGRPDAAAAFVGDMTFIASLRRVLGREQLEARLTFGRAIPSQGRSRRELAALGRSFVVRALADGNPTAVSAPSPVSVPRAA